MHIGIIWPNLSPEAGGGYTFCVNFLNSLMDVMRETGHTFCVLEYMANDDRKSDQLRDMLRGSNIDFIGWPRRPKGQGTPSLPVIAFRRAKALARFVIKGPPEYSPPPVVKDTIRARMHGLLRAAGVQLAIYICPEGVDLDIPYFVIPWDLQHRLQPWFPEVSSNGEWASREEKYSFLLPRASLIIPGTEVGKQDLKTFYRIPDERIRVLPYSTPDTSGGATGEEVLREYGIPSDYLLYPAQFWAHKNHVNLLWALRILREEFGMPMPLVLVGSDGGNLDHVRNVVEELRLSESVHILGFVPREELMALYGKAFALSFVTFFGPDNLPPLEAFARGCPVLASDVPGAREQLGDAALFVNPADPYAIASAVKSLRDDPTLRNALIKRGLERSRQVSPHDYVRAVLRLADEFDPVRRCWGAS